MHPWRSIASFSKEETRRLQSRKLHHFLNHYLYPFSPHYHQLFDDNKIDPKKIRTIEDLKYIPFTSKLDLVSTTENPTKFRDFVMQPDKPKIMKHWPIGKQLPLALTSVIRGTEYTLDRFNQEFRPVFMTFTTGTTNKPVPFLYSNYDIKNLYTSGARMLYLFNIKNTEHIVNIFPYAPHLAFWQVVYGGFAACALILSTGGGRVMGTDGNINAILNMRPSVILGVPSFVYHVLRVAREKKCKMDFVKKVVLGASRVTPAFKMKLAEILSGLGANDVQVLGTYGFTEARCAWAECPTPLDQTSGYHLYSDKEIFEVIDPKTGEVKKDGEDGELVYTSIDSRASAVIRYRTGDFVKGGLTYEPCPYCKRSVIRISSDISRLSDVKDLQLSKIKGSLVNLNNFSLVMAEVRDAEEWQVEIRKKDNDPYEIDELVVYVCAKKDSDHRKVEEQVREEMIRSTEVTPNAICFIPMDEMVRRLDLEGNKEKRIIDARPKI